MMMRGNGAGLHHLTFVPLGWSGLDSGSTVRVPLLFQKILATLGRHLSIYTGASCVRWACALRANPLPIQILSSRRGEAPSGGSYPHASPGRGRRWRRRPARGEGSSEADACGRAAMALLCFLLDLRNIPPPLLHRLKQVPTTLPRARPLPLSSAHSSVELSSETPTNPVRRRGLARGCSACYTSPTSTPPQRHRLTTTPRRPPPTPANCPTAWPSATSTPPPPNRPPRAPPLGLRSVIHPLCS